MVYAGQAHKHTARHDRKQRLDLDGYDVSQSQLSFSRPTQRSGQHETSKLTIQPNSGHKETKHGAASKSTGAGPKHSLVAFPYPLG